jgi:hypothetical protein
MALPPRPDIQASEVALRVEIARPDDGMVGTRTFNRHGTLVVVVAGLLFAALHACHCTDPSHLTRQSLRPTVRSSVAPTYGHVW